VGSHAPHPPPKRPIPCSVKCAAQAFSPQPAENISLNSFPKFADHFPHLAHTRFMVLNQDDVSGRQFEVIANLRHTALRLIA